MSTTLVNALIQHLKEWISWHQSATLCRLPLSLPNDVVVFCTNALHTSHETVIQSWKAFCELVWWDKDTDDTVSHLKNGKLLGLFLQHRYKHAIGVLQLFGNLLMSWYPPLMPRILWYVSATMDMSWFSLQHHHQCVSWATSAVQIGVSWGNSIHKRLWCHTFLVLLHFMLSYIRFIFHLSQILTALFRL